jgi:hypothetical protein
MLVDNVAEAIAALPESDPLTALICVIGLVIITIFTLRSKRATVRLIFKHIHTILKSVTIVSFSLVALILSYAATGRAIEFFIGVVVAVIFCKYGLDTLNDQLREARDG